LQDVEKDNLLCSISDIYDVFISLSIFRMHAQAFTVC
jgi:hypothetical protein